MERYKDQKVCAFLIGDMQCRGYLKDVTENEIIVHNFQIRKNDNKLRQISDGMAYIGEEDDPSDVAIIPKSSIIALVKF